MMKLFDDTNIVVTTQGQSNEWYTPTRYVDAASEVMNGIDLDPASCEIANRTVKAKRYYTIEDDGLKQDWSCKSMWLNPPYGKTDATSNQELWTNKLVNLYEVGVISEAILLVTASTEVMWFQKLWNYPICFSVRRDRVRFFSPTGSTLEHPHGTVFVYFGPNESRFIEVFSQFGRIAKAIDTPKSKPTMRTLWEVE